MQSISAQITSPNGFKLDVSPVNIGEVASYFRQQLSDQSATCSITNYSLEYKNGNQWLHLNEYVELSAVLKDYMGDNEKLNIRMVVEDYDVRTAKMNVSRLRELLQAPPFTFLETDEGDLPQANENHIESSNKKDNSLASEDNVDNTTDEARPETGDIDDEDDSYDFKVINEINIDANTLQTTNLGSFFKETLMYSLDRDTDDSTCPLPAECIQRIQYSGWNPPPPIRRLQGDLFYLEVLTNADGIFYITASPKGFYVNNSTETTFDPSPATSPHFAHELLNTLISACPSLMQAWKRHHRKSNRHKKSSALANISTLFAQGYGDNVTLLPHWIFPPTPQSSILKSPKGSKQKVVHTYDPHRATEELLDCFGLDDKGSPREWNEEIQSIRELPADDIQLRVTQAKYLYKTMSEFGDCCRRVCVAIVDGHIPPINPGEPDLAAVYLYNNIFFSKAVDNKDTFRVVEGDVAARKYAGLDLRNQRYLIQCGIEGLNTTLTAVVDYKGERLVGQGIIPGVLSSGDRCARLMYGFLEGGKRVTCKGSVRPILEKLQKAFRLVKRSLPSVPVPVPAPTCTALTKDAEDGEDDAAAALGSDKEQASIKVDDEDEEFPMDSPSLEHVGPLEMKLLQGSDKRLYALEMTRLTPRDANYVAGPKGTQMIPSEELSKIDEGLLRCYVLRRELVMRYVQDRVIEEKRSMLKAMQLQITGNKTASDETGSKEVLKKEKSITPDATSTSVVGTDPSHSSVESSSATTLDTEKPFQLTQEMCDNIANMSSDSIEFEVNPNSFLGFDVDIDMKVIEQDETKALGLATYLWSTVLPAITQKIRAGDASIIDGIHLVEFLHTEGVNIRYLGQLARLSRKEEKEDEDGILRGIKRRNAMPLYWVDLLETEMISRCVKHILGETLRSSANARVAPLAHVVAMLNHCLGSEDILPDLCDESPTTSTSTGSKANKKKKNKKTNDSTGETTASSIDVIPTSPTVPTLVNPEDVMTRQQFWERVGMLLAERYSYSLDLVLVPINGGAGLGLSSRVTRVSLLRRICQIFGIRIAPKDFNFNSLTPFRMDDVQGLTPVLRTCEPEPFMPEFRSNTESIRIACEEGNLAEAFEYAQLGSALTHQVLGPVHKSTNQVTQNMALLLTASNDFSAAASLQARTLAGSVQLEGLDGADTVMKHADIANSFSKLDDHVAAIAHLQAAIYIMFVITSPRHVLLEQLYARISNEFFTLKQYSLATKYIEKALAMSVNGDQLRHALHCNVAAEYYSHMEDGINDAVRLQKESYTNLKQLLGDDDVNTLDAKERCEKLRRTATEKAVAIARAKQEEADAERERQLMDDWLDEPTASSDQKKKKSTGKSKGKNGKKK